MDVVNPRGFCPSFEDKDNGICYTKANRPNKFQTHGALIGGPKTATDSGDQNRKPYSPEGWNDWRTDWVGSEQTLDYNAGLTVALASALDLPKSFWTSPCGGVTRYSLCPQCKNYCVIAPVKVLHKYQGKCTGRDFAYNHDCRVEQNGWLMV